LRAKADNHGEERACFVIKTVGRSARLCDRAWFIPSLIFNAIARAIRAKCASGAPSTKAEGNFLLDLELVVALTELRSAYSGL
jgi:hypothetical protein